MGLPFRSREVRGGKQKKFSQNKPTKKKGRVGQKTGPFYRGLDEKNSTGAVLGRGFQGKG
jgi:hypothetical protein